MAGPPPPSPTYYHCFPLFPTTRGRKLPIPLLPPPPRARPAPPPLLLLATGTGAAGVGTAADAGVAGAGAAAAAAPGADTSPLPPTSHLHAAGPDSALAAAVVAARAAATKAWPVCVRPPSLGSASAMRPMHWPARSPRRSSSSSSLPHMTSGPLPPADRSRRVPH
jgi:hypothetical protein